jgi:hypothetical protein
VQYSIRILDRPSTSPVFRSLAMVVTPRPRRPDYRTVLQDTGSGWAAAAGRRLARPGPAPAPPPSSERLPGPPAPRRRLRRERRLDRVRDQPAGEDDPDTAGYGLRPEARLTARQGGTPMRMPLEVSPWQQR